MFLYRLIAHNSQGASVEFWGNTKRECLTKFLQQYSRKGFTFKYYFCGEVWD